MSIVGGAIMPYLMGLMAERYSTAISYLIPAVCFIVVAWYGWSGYKINTTNIPINESINNPGDVFIKK
jgi:FHS family L-fucose permease-like MFS transporter